MSSEQQTDGELLPFNPIRVETAISRFPVHRLSRKGTICISIHEGHGGDVETRWEVTHNSTYGQPGPLAYKLDTLIVNRRIEEVRRPISKLIRLGSLKELCRELGLAETGGNTNQIKKALSQNALAGIKAKTRYRMNDGGERSLEAIFTRYSVIFTGEELPNGRKADAVYVILNDVFMKVINGAMTRPLDYDYLKSLPPAPQRFYELISYQMYAAIKNDRPRARLTYSDLCAHAPQMRHTDWNRVRSQMSKVHRPHLLSGYIAKVDFQETTEGEGMPDWIMHYQPGPKARAEFRAFNKRGGPSVLEVEPFDETPLLAPPHASELEQELTTRGITAEIASDLVREHGEAKIRLQIDILDWRLCGKKGDKIDDPAAWLVSAIRSSTGHAVPKGFVSREERQRREEAKAAKERKAGDERRLKDQAQARDKEHQTKVTAYWAALTTVEQTTLDNEANALADPAILAKEIGPLKRLGQHVRRETYIRRLLNLPPAGTEAT